MASPGMSALNFLITTAFDLYIMVVAIRFLMQLTRADYHNPLSQFVVKVTNPLLIPLRRVVPGFAGTDVAALVLCFLLLFIKLTLFKAMGFSDMIGGYSLSISAASWPLIAVLALIALVELFFNVFIYAIIAQAILSWFNTGYNPVYGILHSITSPVLEPVRKVVPPISGIDLSALVAIIGLQALKMFVIPTLLRVVL
ncbi:MAG: YggT family protein [Gammaproteobacteria bacterium]|nr:YggT family protein [Gammaproteobacteria bacterium]